MHRVLRTARKHGWTVRFKLNGTAMLYPPRCGLTMCLCLTTGHLRVA